MMATAYKNGHHGHHHYCARNGVPVPHQDEFFQDDSELSDSSVGTSLEAAEADSESCDWSVGTFPGTAEEWKQRQVPYMEAAAFHAASNAVINILCK